MPYTGQGPFPTRIPVDTETTEHGGYFHARAELAPPIPKLTVLLVTKLKLKKGGRATRSSHLGSRARSRRPPGPGRSGPVVSNACPISKLAPFFCDVSF